jgi:hypothetical protein
MYYSTTESWNEVKNNIIDLRNAAEDWHGLCEQQVEQLGSNEITLGEFMDRAFGTLVPILLQSIFGEAYTRAINVGDKNFDERPDGTLDRRQQELLVSAYDICREYELKGLKTFHQAIPESEDIETLDHLNRPISPLAELVADGF